MHGRLKPNVSLDAAQRELDRIGKEMAAANPEAHKHIRPTVLPYTFPFVDVDSMSMSWAAHALQVSITLLLVLVCANVSTLIYARTATRQGEIAVRTALGASRRRIVAQLFVEGLVLAAIASIAGLTLAKLALHQINTFFTESLGGEIPFWLRPEISTGVIIYTIIATVLAAMIVGALPALKATGRRVQSQLRQLGGGSGMVLGRTWTILIIAQVAFAVAILPVTLHNTWEFATYGLGGPGFPAEKYLFGYLSREEDNIPTQDSITRAQNNRAMSAAQAKLIQRLQTEELVGGATFAWRLPGKESAGMIEVEGLPLPKDSVRYSMGEGSRHGYFVKMNRVAPTFLRTFGVTVRQGRALAAEDSTTDVVMVNTAFARKLLPNTDPIGRRFRYVGRGADADGVNVPLNRWYRIVGVVSNFPASELGTGDPALRVYHPPVPAYTYAMMFVRIADGYQPAGFASRFKAATASVDPAMQLSDVRTLHEELMEEQRMMRLGAIALITLTVSVLLLSAAGIYSLMSLTVNQRRREIGIRSALGAYPRNIMAAVFRRATRQLATGVLIGIVAVLGLDALSRGFLLQGRAPALVPLVAGIIAVVGLLAAWGPARRGLSIQPTEALREL
jgi:predicted permease